MLLDKGSAKKSDTNPSNGRLVSNWRQHDFDLIPVDALPLNQWTTKLFLLIHKYLVILIGFDDLTSVRTVLNKRSGTCFLSTWTRGLLRDSTYLRFKPMISIAHSHFPYVTLY